MRTNNTPKVITALLFSLIIAAAACCGAAAAAPPEASCPARAPWIGITSTLRKGSLRSPFAYAEAVHEAGGIPVILPTVDDDALRNEYVRRLDGLVLIGGGDVPPAAYGEEAHETTKPMPEQRWKCEPPLIRAWLASGKPLLGVCLGSQMVNVLRGGSLIQDIPSQVGKSVVHRLPRDETKNNKKEKKEAKEKKRARHPVTLLADSQLRELLGSDRITVNSAHHQAIKRVGRGLRATAHSDDGVIEAVEMPGHRWAIFVQWHPEQMDKAHRKAIFGALIRACKKAPAPKLPPQEANGQE
jgi:putative glutamine amidotransferase